MKTIKTYRIVDYMLEQFMLIVNEMKLNYSSRRYDTMEHTAVKINATHNELKAFDDQWDRVKSYSDPQYTQAITPLHAQANEERHELKTSHTKEN